jgi:hypothetical protein
VVWVFQLDTTNDGSGRHVSFALSLVVVLEHVSLSLAHHDGPVRERERESERGSVENSEGAEGVVLWCFLFVARVCVTVCVQATKHIHGVLGTYATGYDTILTGCVTLAGDDDIRVRSFLPVGRTRNKLQNLNDKSEKFYLLLILVKFTNKPQNRPKNFRPYRQQPIACETI